MDFASRLFLGWKKAPFFYTVLGPVLAYFVYAVLFASSRYESHSSITVQSQSSMQGGDPALMLLMGVGGTGAGPDAAIVAEYISSADMYLHLNDSLGLKEHYRSSGDFFSSLKPWSDFEDELEFFRSFVVIELNDKSQVLSLRVQGFTPEFAKLVAQNIISRAEWYINSISRGLAEEQLEFIRGESALVESRLARARGDVLDFQQKNGLLDPEAEGVAQQQIAYTLEGQISTKKTELRVLRAVMSEDAPQVRALVNELAALELQLAEERGQLSVSTEAESSVSDVMAQYTGLRLELELALQAYTAAQVSMEQARMDVYKQLKYLVTIQSPTLPEKAAYPRVFYNSILLLLLLGMIFGVVKILVSVHKELD